MVGIIGLIYIIGIIWIFIDVTNKTNSIGKGFLYAFGTSILWIIIVPLWFFYERKKYNKNYKNKKEIKHKEEIDKDDKIFIITMIIIIIIGILFVVFLNYSINENMKDIQLKNKNVNTNSYTSKTDTPQNKIDNTPTCKNKCSFTGYQCYNNVIISCEQQGDCKTKKTEKRCPNACSTGHCVYNIGDTITKNNVNVTLISAENLYIPPKFSGSGNYRFVVSNSEDVFKVRIKVKNNAKQEKKFTDPTYSMVVLDDIGNQYEPIYFYGGDKEQKDFGSGIIYPKVTKIGDVYFDKIAKNATELRIIIKDGFFTIYTNDDNKGFTGDKSFEWIKSIE